MVSKRIAQVFEKLLPVYEKAIKEMPKNNWIHYVFSNSIHSGLCLAAMVHAKESISDEMKTLTEEFVPGTFYWHSTPNHVYEYEEALECLQWRVDKMKEMLNQ